MTVTALDEVLRRPILIASARAGGAAKATSSASAIQRMAMRRKPSSPDIPDAFSTTHFPGTLKARRIFC
jgi:hypothetical protein